MFDVFKKTKFASTLNAVGYLIVYNEEDVIENVVEHHLNQGLKIVVLDNGSTDKTPQIVSKLASSNKILGYESYPTINYAWQNLIKKGYELAIKYNPDWLIHLDASAFLESSLDAKEPLIDQIIKADNAGCNIINLRVYDFYPTEKDDPTELNVFKRMKYYLLRGNLSIIQEKIYKFYPGIITYEGHTITFPFGVEKKIFDKPAIMRHYVFRSEKHGVQKILERKNRWNDEERKLGSHVHYDSYLGFNDEVIIPSHKLSYKYENSSWKDMVMIDRDIPLPSERHDVNKTGFFDEICQMNSDICFIVGCQRSGTTLIRLILETSSQTSCYEEPTCYDYWADRNLLENEISQKRREGKNLFVFKTPCITEQFNNHDGIAKELRYNKFPFPFKYDGQLLLFLVRDPRDVSLSLQKLKKHSTGNDWIDIWHNYIDKLYPMIMPGFNKKYSKELEIIKHAGEFTFSAKVALYWKIKTQAFFEYDQLGYKMMLILYEDLVTSPDRNIKQICKFLRIQFHQDMLRHHQLEHSHTNEKGLTVGDTNVKRPIDQNAIRLYKNVMSIKEQEIILSITGDLYKKIQKKWIQQLRNQAVN